MPFTTAYANTLLTGLCGKNAQPLTNCYMALSTTTINADGTGITEPSGNGYERAMVGYGTQSYTQKMGTPSSGTVTNTDIIFFPEATGDWGEIVAFALYSAQTGGTMYVYGDVTPDSDDADATLEPGDGDVLILREGKFTLSIT